MKDIVIIGAGGLGRETEWLIERINNSKQEKEWNILGYVDDNIPKGQNVRHSSVIYNIDDLLNIDSKTYVVIAIANVYVRKKIYEKLKENSNLEFPNLIDPTVTMGDVELGIGNIICANSLLTIDVKVGNFTIINFNCTIAHNSELGNFISIHPNANISGNVHINDNVEIGTGTQITQLKSVCSNVVIGAGSVIVKSIKQEGIYIAPPVQKLK